MATVAFAEWTAPPGWSRIDFLSDLHLAEDTPRTFEAWSHHLRHTPADAVVILGDLFEAWIGDDARHTGFEARCADVLKAAARRCSVSFMAGNRDFLVGSDMLQACGIVALADPTVLVAFGQRVLLSHGDQFCVDDHAYQRWRATVQQPAWQRQALAHPLAERRSLARRMREASRAHQQDVSAGRAFDADRTMALAWMGAANASVLVHGHTHRPGSDELAPGRVRHVLSDWDLDHAARGDVLRLDRDGIVRIDLAHRAAPARS